MTGLASTASLYVGEPVSGSGIPAGTTIAQLSTPSSIALSQASTTSGSDTLTFFSDFQSRTGTLSTSTEVTGLATTLGLIEGEQVTGAGIPAGTSIAAIDSSASIVLSQHATTSGPTSLSFVTNDTAQAATLNSTTLVTGLARTAGFFAGELVTGAGIPTGTTIAQIDSASSLTLSQAATAAGSTVLIFPQPFDARNYVYVAGASSNTLTLFARNPATNSLTWLQTLQDGADGVRGLGDPTGLAVTPDSQYLYVTSGSENSLAVFGTGPNGTLQVDQDEFGAIGLTAPSGLAVSGTSDNAYVSSSSGIASGNGGLASFTALASTTPSSLSLSYSSMQQVAISLGNAPNTITEINHATTGPVTTNPGPATLVLLPGTGANTINLLDPAGTTIVSATGTGGNRVTASVTAQNSNVFIIPGDGTNNVELDAAAAGDQIIISLGNGNSTAQIEGTEIDPNASVDVTGGTGSDTLFYDRQTAPLLFYDQFFNPVGQPSLKNGAIQAQGFGLTEYSLITNLTGFSGPAVNPRGPYVISQGQPLSLNGSSTGTTIQAGWDFNGDNNFTDATGLNTSVSWATLVSLGLSTPGTYPVGLRVEADTGTVTEYTTVTIMAARPKVSFSLTGNPTVGVPYKIDNFAVAEATGVTYGATSWAVNWGDGTPSNPDIETLSSQATSATHTYTTAANDQITLIASDPYYNNSQTVLTGTLNPGGLVTGLSSTSSLYETEGVSGPGLPGGIRLAHILSGSEIAIPLNVSSPEPVTLTFTSTPTSSISQGVQIKYGSGSVTTDVPSVISAGSSLTLEATAAGNVPSSDFFWNLVGTPTNPHYVQFSGATTSFANGYTTYTATVNWNQGGLDEGSYQDVMAQVRVAGQTGTSSPTTLTVSDTAPTATISTKANPDGSITVSFTNPTDPSPSQTSDGFTYSYDFDDDGTFMHDGVSYANLSNASENVPSDLLAQPGSFVVRLRISAQDTTYTDYNTIISVPAVPPAVTIGSNQSGTATPGTPFALTNVTFTDPFYSTALTNWSFTSTIDWGDGTSSPGVVTVTQGNPGNPAENIPPVATSGSISASHLYTTDLPPGAQVQVSVRDSDGNVGTAGFPITVSPPTVAIVTPNSEQTVAVGAIFIPSQVYFTDSAGTAADVVSIDWGDGQGAQNVPQSDIVEPVTSADHGTIGLGHTYGFPGQYNVTMTVTDPPFQTSKMVTFPVDVVDVAPTVIAGANISQSPGVPVSIAAGFSSPSFPTNGNQETYSYTIEWGDGHSSIGTASDMPGTDSQATTGSISGTHIYASHGNFTVTVTVTDSKGNAGSDSLLVNDIPPTVTISPNQVQTVNQGSPLVVSATFNDPGFETGATAGNYPATIDWGDGQTSQGTVQITQAGGTGTPTLGTVTGSHFYADQGLYPVTVFVADDGGGVGQATFNASVNFTTPSLASLAGGVYVPNQLLTVTDTFTEPGIAPNDFVTVDWGDGTTYSFDSSSYFVNSSGVKVPYLVEPTATNPGMILAGHTYTGTGPETVTITVTDKDGLSSTQSAIYQVAAATSTSVTSSTPGNMSVYGQPVTFTATVTPPGGMGVATGMVTFKVNGVAELTESLNNQGSARFTPSQPLPVGQATITVFYAGAGGLLPSDNTGDPLVQTVNKDSTTTTPSSSAATSSFGQSVSFTAGVAANAPGSGAPTGSVDFYDVTTADDLGTVTLTAGSASLSIATLPVGLQTISETYSGDGDFKGGSTSLSQSVLVAIYVVNSSTISPTITGPVYLSGSSSINIPGRLIVDSPASPAVTLTGTSRIVASSVGVVGKVSESGNASISPTPTTGITAVADPLASLAVPSLTGTAASVNLTSGSQTISQGIYSQIKVSGTGTRLILNPGVYVITGGGFSVTNSASVTGNGVTIYNAGSSYPSTGGTYGGITLNTAGSVNLTAPLTGSYAGILLFQARTNPTAVSITGSGALGLTGVIYATDALLSLGGSVQITDALVVNRLQMTGSPVATFNQVSGMSMLSATSLVSVTSAGPGPVAFDATPGLSSSLPGAAAFAKSGATRRPLAITTTPAAQPQSRLRISTATRAGTGITVVQSAGENELIGALGADQAFADEVQAWWKRGPRSDA